MNNWLHILFFFFGASSLWGQVFINAFCELLCQSQNYVREAGGLRSSDLLPGWVVFWDVLQVNEGERSVVSMRDIGRAARVFKWLLD